MKYLIVMSLLFLTTFLHAQPKTWTNTVVDRNNLSPVDNLVISEFPKGFNVYKLSHPDVSTVKIYVSTNNSKVIYVVWKWKPSSGWVIMDASMWNSETKLAKGIPIEFLDYLNLESKPAIDYGEKFKKNLPKIRKSKIVDGKGNHKGYAEFDSDDIAGMNAFHMAHNIKFATYKPVADYARHTVLFYDDGAYEQKVEVPYDVENE